MPGPAAPDVAVDARAEQRAGTLAGVVAYSLWGVSPLVFHQLRSVGAGEILAHRLVWAFLVVAGLLALRRDWRWFAGVRTAPGALPRLTAAAVLIAVNWLVYIWAVTHGHVVEAALGYYVNPLLTVALGVVVLGEHCGACRWWRWSSGRRRWRCSPSPTGVCRGWRWCWRARSPPTAS